MTEKDRKIVKEIIKVLKKHDGGMGYYTFEPEQIQAIQSLSDENKELRETLVNYDEHKSIEIDTLMKGEKESYDKLQDENRELKSSIENAELPKKWKTIIDGDLEEGAISHEEEMRRRYKNEAISQCTLVVAKRDVKITKLQETIQKNYELAMKENGKLQEQLDVQENSHCKRYDELENQIGRVNVKKMVKVMTEEEIKITKTTSRDVTRVELAQALDKFIKENKHA